MAWLILLLSRAERALKEGMLEVAMAYTEKALEINGDFPVTLELKGRINKAMKNWSAFYKKGSSRHIFFEIAESEEELKEIYKLRYTVYVVEDGIIPPDKVKLPGIEMDDYDRNSVHFIARKGDKIVGYVRLILDSPQGLPLERDCDLGRYREKGRKIEWERKRNVIYRVW